MPWSRRTVRPRAAVVAVLGVLAAAAPAVAQTTYGAAASGDWGSAATWNPGGVPGAGDIVYIGSSTPFGAAPVVTVGLTQGQSAGTVYLGYDTGSAGTLNLGTSQLTVTNLFIGLAGGDGVVQRGAGGAIVATNLISVTGGGNTLGFAAGDAAANLSLSDGATATNVAAGNVTQNAYVDGAGSRLTLGSSLSVSGTVSATGGGVLDLAGHSLTAATIALDGAAPALADRGSGTLTATSGLALSGGQSFAFAAADTAGYLSVSSGAAATTAATGNVTGSAQVDGAGSRLTLGADLSLGAGTLRVGNGGTLDFGGRAVSAGTVELGNGGGTLVGAAGRGTLTATTLTLTGLALDLRAGDAVQTLNLFGGATSATAAGAVAQSAAVDGAGSRLTLGGGTTLAGGLSVSGGGVLDMANSGLTAATVALDGATPALANRGTLVATGSLAVSGGQAFAFAPADATPSLSVSSGATAATAAVGNVTQSAQVEGAGSRLTLGADLSLGAGSLSVTNGGTLDFGGRAVAAGSVSLGSGGAALVGAAGRGGLTATTLTLAGLALDLRAGDGVQTLSLAAGATSTAPAGTLAQNAFVDGTGSRLTLGGGTTLAGTLAVSNGGVADLGGNPLTAANITLDGPAPALANRGGLTAASGLAVSGGQAFAFAPGDGTPSLSVSGGATATTTVTGNVTQNVQVDGAGSRLTLGAALTLGGGGSLGVSNGGVVNAQGRGVTAGGVTVAGVTEEGVTTGSVLQNAGPVVTNRLTVSTGSQAGLVAGDSSVGTLAVQDGSTVTVSNAGGRTGRLTVTDPATAALAVLDTSVLRLELDAAQPGQVFRWQNPVGGDHVADLTALIAGGQVQFTFVNGGGYQIGTDSTYTFIAQPVPEPAAVLAAAAGGLLLARRRFRPATA